MLEEAATDFRAFIKMTMPSYDFNWHHEVLIDRLNKLAHQKNQRLMVSMPPRHGKSELVSRRFPAFYLGLHPNNEIISCSYSSGLASLFNRDIQRIMESEIFTEVFPDTVLPGSKASKNIESANKFKRTANFFEIVNHYGSLLSAGVGGSITGLGADLLLIDDPVKNEEEAMSETYRENVFNWYNSTAYTRLEGGANIVVVQTRWHKGDLSGKLLSEMELGGDKWEVINFPAILRDNPTEHDIRQPGDALWPRKYPIDRLDIIKKQVGSRVWSSLYQQSPIVEGGNIIKEEWLKYYTKLPFDPNRWRGSYLVASWDLSFKETGKSYVVGVMIAKHESDYYLLDIYRKKADIVETQRAIKEMADTWPNCKIHLVEDKANGPAIIALMKQQVSGLVAVKADVSKDERLHSIAPIFEAGNFHIPANHPYTKYIIDELTSFPHSDNDDIVDAISQGLNRFSEMRGLRHLRAMTKWQ
jgi:predicted phage terminase large subunit-like protein